MCFFLFNGKKTGVNLRFLCVERSKRYSRLALNWLNMTKYGHMFHRRTHAHIVWYRFRNQRVRDVTHVRLYLDR